MNRGRRSVMDPHPATATAAPSSRARYAPRLTYIQFAFLICAYDNQWTHADWACNEESIGFDGPESQRSEGDGAAAEDPGEALGGAGFGAAHERRGRLPFAGCGAHGCGPGDRVPGPDAVRTGRPAGAPALRGRARGVRVERGPAPRSPGVPDLRPGRGVRRSGDRAQAEGDRGRARLRAAGSLARVVR